MKSKKYRNHYMSKHEYPTHIISGSGAMSGGITVGHRPALRALQGKLGRQLHPDTKVRTKGGNWAFMEPL